MCGVEKFFKNFLKNFFIVQKNFLKIFIIFLNFSKKLFHNGVPVETSFRSLNAASKKLSINISTLKGLSCGKTPKLPENAPKNLTVIQIPTLSKPADLTNGKYYCDICEKYIQNRSKYEHIITKSHLKIKKILEENKK